MRWRARPLVPAALGTLLAGLAATSALASTPQTTAETRPLQFTSGGHIVAFTSRDLHVASGSHALRVEFIGAQNVTPIADGAAAPDGTSTPLTRVAYPGIWRGITLAYDAPGALLRSTYTLAPGADPAQIGLRYNVPVVVEPGGDLRITFATGAMRESAPVAWQDIENRRIPVAVAFRKTSEEEVGFFLGPYDTTRPLTIDPTLSWNTFLGGSGGDDGSGIAIDASGNVYVTGYSAGTWGDDPKREWLGNTDAFVAKLDSDGALLWNTFLGGAGYDRGYGIAVDAGGNVVVTGFAEGTWENPQLPWAGSYDAFVAKLDTDGALLWNTFLGWSGYDHGYGVAVDASSNVYVTGYSEGTWGTPIRSWAGSYDAFVAKLDTDGALQWNTFLGGAGDKGYGIAVDGSGNAYVTGYSAGEWGTPERQWAGGYDACVAKLDTDGALQWNTFLGGIADDGGAGIAVDASGAVYVTGFSVAEWGDPIRTFSGGTSDAFVVKLDSSGVLLWNSFLGGTTWDGGAGIAVNASGEVSVTGGSSSTWGDPTWGYVGGDSDAFVAGLDTDGVLLRNDFLGGSLGDDGSGIAVAATGATYVTGASSATWGDPRRARAGAQDAFVAKAYPLPRAVDDTAVTDEDTPVILAVLANDAVQVGSTLVIESVTAPAHGAAEIVGDSVRYTPAENFNGEDRFTYSATDGRSTVTATVTVTVNPVNDPPVATEQSVTVAEDTAAQITLGASDAENDPMTYVVVAEPAHGSLSGTTPLLTYTPDADYSGPDSFTFRADDPSANGSVAMVSITVTPVNDAPVASNDSYAVAKGGILNDLAPGVLGNDSDAEHDVLTAVKVTDPEHGTLTLHANGSFTYVHDGSETTSDSFTYKANDGLADSNVATVAITVSGENHPPSLPAIADREAAEGTLIEFTVTGTDPEGDSMTYAVDPLPAGASLAEDTGLFRWVPRLDQAGVYHLTFTATDGVLVSDPVATTITVSNPIGPVFFDNFTDGAAPSDWRKVSGLWSGGQGVFTSRSLSKNNVARIALLDPLALPLSVGVVQAKVKLTSTSSGGGPNGMLIFGYQDPKRYRWVRISRSDLRIGQTGTIGGITGGTKKRVARNHAIGRFVLLTVKISPEGWVRVYETAKMRLVAKYRFVADGLPSVVPGGAGLAASRARTIFDNVKVWEDSALAQ